MKNNRSEFVSMSDFDSYNLHCPNCDAHASLEQVAANAQCPHCHQTWSSIGVLPVIIVDGKKQPKSSMPDFMAALLVAIVLATFGYGLYATAAASVTAARFRLQIFWLNLTEGLKAWFDGIGQLGSTFISLSLITLAALLVYHGLVRLIIGLSSLLVSRSGQTQPDLSPNRVMVGTVGNLFASSCALLCIPLILHRTPDIFDFGVQLLIALIVEYFVLREQ